MTDLSCPICGAKCTTEPSHSSVFSMYCEVCDKKFFLQREENPFGARGSNDFATLCLSSGAPEKSAASRIIGGCRVGRCLGEGAMGTVFHAHHLGLDIPVALKIMHPAVAQKGEAGRDRFLREARAAAKLRHMNIVSVLNVGVENEQPYIVMEYIEGIELHQKLQGGRALPILEAIDIAMQLCDALEAARRTDLVHRDIKPENILIDREGVVKLVDLGVAKVMGDSAELTLTGDVLGTPTYMSPEQGLGEDGVDHRSDLYAVGATLYRMLCGKPPYAGESPCKVIYSHIHDPVPNPRDLRPAIPEDLCAVICRLLAKEPEDRYPTAADTKEALGDVRARLSDTTRWNSAPPARTSTACGSVASGDGGPGSATDALSNQSAARKRPASPSAGASPATASSGRASSSGATTSSGTSRGVTARLNRCLAGRRILVVDDASLIRPMIVKLLSEAGAEVIEADDGEKAVVVLRKCADAAPVELVFSEIQLPGMDGVELLWALRADERFADLPVIVTSKEEDDAVLAECRELGAAGFIAKPCSKAKILEAVCNAIDPACAAGDGAEGVSVDQLRRIFRLLERSVEAAIADGEWPVASSADDPHLALLRDYVNKRSPAVFGGPCGTEVSAGAAAGRRIVVAEDSRTMRSIFAGVVRTTGAEAIECNDGEEAYDTITSMRAAGTPVDLLLLDMVMPKMDGRELLRLLRSDAAYSAFPVVAITSEEASEIEKEVNTLGVATFLQKPCPKKAIREAILVNLPATGAALSRDEVRKMDLLLQQSLAVAMDEGEFQYASIDEIPLYATWQDQLLKCGVSSSVSV